MAAYTFSCFSIFTRNYEDEENRVLIRQDVLLFLLQFAAFFTMFLATDDIRILFFYAALAVVLLGVILLYNLIYPNVSRLVVNNMCMLITAGMIMITRLSADNDSPYGTAIRQLIFVVLGVTFGLVVPVLIRKLTFLDKWTYIYAAAGGGALLLVAVFAQTSGGAKLGFEIFGFNIQPSEFVKIIFVFFVAASLNKSKEFKNVVITTAIAAAHVLILVLSTDLGAALILFVVYLVMLYVATRQPLYAIAGLGAGVLAAVAGYHLFAHIRVRVEAWQDPIATYGDSGYQVAQSLFAIGTGSWFGTGLFQGQPDTIPVAETDFIFSAITEEMGVIYALCLILICGRIIRCGLVRPIVSIVPAAARSTPEQHKSAGHEHKKFFHFLHKIVSLSINIVVTLLSALFQYLCTGRFLFCFFPQFFHSPRLDLAHALPGHSQHLANLFQGVCPAVFQPVPQPDHLALSVAERLEQLLYFFLAHKDIHRFLGRCL